MKAKPRISPVEFHELQMRHHQIALERARAEAEQEAIDDDDDGIYVVDVFLEDEVAPVFEALSFEPWCSTVTFSDVTPKQLRELVSQLVDEDETIMLKVWHGRWMVFHDEVSKCPTSLYSAEVER